MKKLTILAIIVANSFTANTQLVDLKNLDLSKLIGQTLQVKQGWAPKFMIGNISLPKMGKVGELFNLKNVQKAKTLFKTFKTGRTVYKLGAYAGLATSLYSSYKNIAATAKLEKATVADEIKKYSNQIEGAKSTMIVGGATILSGVLVKLLTKQAASKAADAFNGKIRKKLSDILSFDTPTPSPYGGAGLALKIKL
jgi:hypothetical protein